MATVEDIAFIEKRQENWRQAHNTCDINRLMKWASEDLDYSDYAIGITHISKPALKELATNIFSSVSDMEHATVSVNGNKSFTAWEWTAKGKIVKPIPGFSFKEGDAFEMVGCSLFWWKGEGEGGSIVKMAEYPKFVGI